MEIKCKCGEMVARGEVKISERISQSTGEPHSRTSFIIEGQISGIILKNGSENPRKWTGQCSRCQSSNHKEKHAK